MNEQKIGGIHRWSWGIAWMLFGAAMLGLDIPYIAQITGGAFAVAGIAYIMGK